MGRKDAERNAALRRQGLPTFCSLQNYVPSLNACIVPLSELPLADSWVSCVHQPNKNISDAPDQVFSGGKQYEFQETVGEIDYEDDHQSNFASDSEAEVEHSHFDVSELPGANGRSWSRAMVDKAPMFFRRMLGAGDFMAESYSIGVSAAFFPSKMRQPTDAELDEHMLRGLASRHQQCAVLALHSSGYFAGGIFRGTDALVHKTLHRYTSRAKQGGSQIAFDASGKKAKSAGSNLRRYCHQRLQEEIRELLTHQWAAELAACDRIFIAVSNKMRSSLIGTREHPYVAFDRVSSLPFAVPKPTFEAVSSAYRQVTGVLFCSEQTMEKFVAKSSPSSCAKVDAREAPEQFRSALHIAAAAGEEDEIVELLDAGSDPTVQDSRGRVPFEVCLSRGARRVFRFWREQNENAWDWSAARVPGGNADMQEDEAKGGKANDKRQKSKTEHKREPPNNVPPSSPSGSVDSACGKVICLATKPPKITNKGRTSIAYSTPHISRKNAASAKSAPQPTVTPRRTQRLSSSHRLAI